MLILSSSRSHTDCKRSPTTIGSSSWTTVKSLSLVHRSTCMKTLLPCSVKCATQRYAEVPRTHESANPVEIGHTRYPQDTRRRINRLAQVPANCISPTSGNSWSSCQLRIPDNLHGHPFRLCPLLLSLPNPFPSPNPPCLYPWPYPFSCYTSFLLLSPNPSFMPCVSALFMHTI